MKREILMYLLTQRHKLDARTKKRMLIGGAVLSVFLVIGAIFAVVFAVKLGSYALSQVQTAAVQIAGAPSPNLPAIAENVASKPCTTTLWGLTSLDPWLHKPLSETWKSVQTACLSGSGQPHNPNPNSVF